MNTEQVSAEVQDFLSPKLGMLPAILEKTLLLAGPAYFPETTFNDVKIGDVCYVVYTLDSGGKKEVNWGYLAEAIGVNDTHVRYHLTDVYKVAGTVQNKEWYDNVSRTDKHKVFLVGGTTTVGSEQSYAPAEPAKKISNDQPITNHYEDQISDVVESCGKKLLQNKDSAFKTWMGGYINKKDGSPNPTFKVGRWKFINAITEKIATSLSITAWQAKGLNADNVEEAPEVAKWLETDFLLPVLAEKTSTMTEEGSKKAYQTEVMPKTPTILKYVIQMVDSLVAEKSAVPSKDEPTPDLKQVMADLKDLKAAMSTLVGSANAIATQLKIREVLDPKEDSSGPSAKSAAKPAVPEATIIPVPGDKHECAYHVMSVAKRINDGTLSVSGAQDAKGALKLSDGTPVLTDEAVDVAKFALMVHAKEAYEADTAQFEALVGFAITQLYKQVLETKQSEKTWATEMHFCLHAKEHPDVELKLKTYREGKLATISTRLETLPPAKLTMFAKWRPGHFELIGLKGDGSVKLAFTQPELQAAERAVDAIMDVDPPPPDMGKLKMADFKDVVWATLKANRALTAPKPAAIIPVPGTTFQWAPTDDAASTKAPLSAASAHEQTVNALHARAQAKQKEIQVQTHLANQARALVKAMQVKQAQEACQPEPVAAGNAASLETFAQQQVVKKMQADLEAQHKQIQAQAQLTLQARTEMQALQTGLQKQQSVAQNGPKAGVIQVQGVDPLDMFIDGFTAANPGAQPVFVILNDAKKKKIEAVLRKLDAKSFKVVQSISKVDSGTPNAHHVVRALARDVSTVQQLVTHLVANGVIAELYDPARHMAMPAANPGGFQQVKGKKKGKGHGLAGKSQTGLTASIDKAGQPPTTRVHGQCDYYSARVGTCPRGDACRFACYNGPAKQ